MLIVFAITLFIVAGLLWWSLRSGAPWVPTSRRVRLAMLELLELKSGETLLDLGAGDGRLLIDAAERFSVRAIGFEVNPVLAAIARVRVRGRGLGDQVELRCSNFFTSALPKADAVTLFLLQDTNQRVEKEILPQFPPGTRVVSYAFTFEGLTPHRIAKPRWGPSIYLYHL